MSIPNTKYIDVSRSEGTEIDQLLELISLFVHDLEGPLAAMQAILRLLENDRLDLNRKNHVDLVKSSEVAMERARAIIGDLMFISKSGQMGIPVMMETVPFKQLIENSLELISSTADEQGIRVVVNHPDRDYVVAADPGLLLRVMDNLLYNAIRHSPPDGEIIITGVARKGYLIVTIADQGPGFNDFDPNELFDKFRQLELRKEGKHRGVGLGLFFCNQAISAMGGKIWAQGRPKGGAEFKFTLKIEE
ncbi:MAG: hypothetical protein GF404_07465 [candidate division Zixibacteria bacterium]|nr:hypothetical protein [candidate division Zixibacteria bacterium]